MPEPTTLRFGTSPSVRVLLRDASLYAKASYPILILGESGAGKTAIARLIHEQSGRAGAFIKQATSWIPQHLEIAHLAGHARGAFTGAEQERIGVIEAAHGGTFLLDELGLASATVQQLLLQLLDDGTIRRVGEVRDRPVDVRFVGATNADLEALVAGGAFRADLRHRFGYLVLRVPSLADRRDEIIPLASAFIDQAARAARLDPPPRFSDGVRDYFMAAPWPGNIRDLQAVCRYAVLHVPAGGMIELCDLPHDFVATQGAVGRARHDRDQLEWAKAALQRAGGNKAEAARLLRCSRQHLYRLLNAAVSVVVLHGVAGRPPVSHHLSHRTHGPTVTRQISRFRQAG